MQYAPYILDHQLIVAVDDTCVKYTTQDEMIQVEEIEDLKCQHEEADTRMVFHLN